MASLTRARTHARARPPARAPTCPHARTPARTHTLVNQGGIPMNKAHAASRAITLPVEHRPPPHLQAHAHVAIPGLSRHPPDESAFPSTTATYQANSSWLSNLALLRQ